MAQSRSSTLIIKHFGFWHWLSKTLVPLWLTRILYAKPLLHSRLMHVPKLPRRINGPAERTEKDRPEGSDDMGGMIWVVPE